MASSEEHGGELDDYGSEQGSSEGTPEIHHSDQGVQYAANEYVRLLEEHEVKISIAEVGQAWQNGYAERTPSAERSFMMRTIKEGQVDLSEYRNFAEAY
jgi:putative transposase